jgi:hypothetical protein
MFCIGPPIAFANGVRQVFTVQITMLANECGFSPYKQDQENGH